MNAFSLRRIAWFWPFAIGLAVAAPEAPRPTAPIAVPSVPTEPAKLKVTKAAIFVSSHAGCDPEGRLGSLEDMIVSGVTEQGLSVIARDTALNAVRQLDPGAGENALDQKLSQNTSAVRLAQNLGADVLLQVTITGYDTKKNQVNAYGVRATNEERTLRVTYKILDGVTGASLAADTVSARRSTQATATAKEDNSGVLADLMEETAKKVALSVKRRLDENRLAGASSAQTLVTITIQTELADVMIPDIRLGAENAVAISEGKFKVSPLAVTVEIDGIAVGTAPGKIQVRPGLSKLRLTRAGFEPYERTINAVNGLTLTAAMTLSADGYARWQDATKFVHGLRNKAKLTDAEVKVLEGKAKELEQSGYRINVNTKEGLTIKNQSLFNQ